MSQLPPANNPAGDATPEGLIRRSLVVAFALAVLKTAAGLAANSLAILASALDSFLDLGASAVNLFSLKMAARPPDVEHPYGRGKAEALAGLAQGAFIAASGLGLAAESVRRLLHGSDVSPGWFGFAVMAVSAGFSLWHSRNLARSRDATGSTVMRTENAHFAMDFLSNVGVIAALLIVRFSRASTWDILVCLAITAYILREAWRVIEYSALELLDRGLPPEVVREIETAIREHHPRVVGFHDLRTRKAGTRIFIEFHIEIRSVQDFDEAHEITEELIDRVRARVPNADVTVHYDPEGAR